MNRRVIVVVLDGLGIGAAPDAADFNSEQTNTLAHVARHVSGLSLPHMEKLGLGNIHPIEGVPPSPQPNGCYGTVGEAPVQWIVLF